jgi:hypothetical protein
MIASIGRGGPGLVWIGGLWMAELALACPTYSAEAFDPEIKAEAFSTDITKNPYFSLPIGSKFVLEAKTDEGAERTEILIPGWTKTVMGIETLVYWDRVYRDGELIEDTRDYLAQHENGDVWYFGEDVDNYEDGKLSDHEGAWLAGVGGAKPGIWVKAAAKVGDKYRQEYLAGAAEDAAEVIGVGERVETPLGSFSDCIKTFEWSPLTPDTAHKYYCRETGTVTLEVDLVSPELDEEVRTKLVRLDRAGAAGIALPPEYAKEGVVSSR